MVFEVIADIDFLLLDAAYDRPDQGLFGRGDAEIKGYDVDES